MKASRIQAALCAAVLSIILTGCGSTAANHQSPSPAPEPSSQIPLVKKEAVVHPIKKLPSGGLPQNMAASKDGPRSMIAEPTENYWANDWCHYFVGTDGITYGDTCIRSTADSAGQAVADHVLIYRYDPNAAEHLGPAVLELYTGYPGFTAYRDLTDPSFNQIAWMAFPNGQIITNDNLWASTYDANSQMLWFQVSALQQQREQTPNLDGHSTGLAPNFPARMPQWDPSVTVFSDTLIHTVYNIPVGIY